MSGQILSRAYHKCSLAALPASRHPKAQRLTTNSNSIHNNPVTPVAPSFLRVARSSLGLNPRQANRRASMSHRILIEPQRVDAPLTSSATFLVLTINDGDEATSMVKSTLASVADLTKNVAIRDSSASFAVTAGIGSRVWDRITDVPRPVELRPFKELKGAKHLAVSTPGD